MALADPATNVQRTIELAQRAVACKAALVIFPELGLSGYSNEDLVLQDALLDSVEQAIQQIIESSRTLQAVLVVGAPLRSEGKLFNCGLVVHHGILLGAVPKTYLPNYREFYEKRQFTSGSQAVRDTLRVAGQQVPFGSRLLFVAPGWDDLVLHVEICEDLWAPVSPSLYAALAGATVLTNLSASDVTVGKAAYRRLLCTSHSAKCIAAHAYAAAGYGESTTDLAWDGHAIVCENGELIAESDRFRYQDALLTADVDLERLRQERTRMTSFNDCVQLHRAQLGDFRRIDFELEVPGGPVALHRPPARYPFVPGDATTLDERCEEVHSIQVQGLVRRMEATGIDKLVIGVSGGLDSTHSLLVAAKAVDALGLPRANILGFTLPGFATSTRTHENALRLMKALGINSREIDIRPSARQMFEDLGHPYARGEPVYDLTFENVQAGERASHLFRLANYYGGLVVGTSDLSELALGYTTYGVGDQMSHYAVNASVPKTLVRHLVQWISYKGEFDTAVAEILHHILHTRISPELVPATRPRRTPKRANQPRTPWGLTSCRISISTISADLAIAPARSPFSRNRRGRMRSAASGPNGLRPRSVMSTPWTRSNIGLKSSSCASSSSVSSSGRRFRTVRKSGRVGRFHLEAIGVPRVMYRPKCGWKNCTGTFPEATVNSLFPTTARFPHMPWSPEYYPPSMTHLPPVVREKAIEIANALLDRGHDEGKAIRIAIAQAKRWATARGITSTQ